MEKILKVHHVNDYARYIGAPELHPLVSVIHYDELEHCRHSLNNYDVYAMFIGDEELEDLSYGQLQYDLHCHALMCVAPGQIGGKADTGEEIHTKGWALLFDTELLRNSELGRRMADYYTAGTDSHRTPAGRGCPHAAHRDLADRAGAGTRQSLLCATALHIGHDDKLRSLTAFRASVAEIL